MNCSAQHCDRPVHGRGMCTLHYHRWRRQNPNATTQRFMPETVEQRFWRQVDGGDAQTCWLWTGRPAKDGYGKFVVRRKWHQAHRFAYESLISEIPIGLELDHLCRNRACVNPWHLEPVTHQINMLRADHWASKGRSYPIETHCANGHERTADNTYVAPGRRTLTCRACNRDAQRRRRKDRLRTLAVAS